MGIAMGVTALLINYSPMGKVSGAHMNPAVSFAFFRLGKMKMNDAIYYSVFQVLGGVVSVWLMAQILGDAFRSKPVSYVMTVPGSFGVAVAFVTEALIAFLMMTMVLITSNHPTLSKYTGAIAGFFVTCYVIITAPISGFSMNPARTLASDVPAMQYPSVWVYLTAPFIGMLGAAEVFVRRRGKAICAKMYHSKSYLCIFNCGYCEHWSEEEMPVS